VNDLDLAVGVDRLDVDLEERRAADPRLVLDLDRVVAHPDNQIGAAQERALHLAAGALDAAERERMVVVDQPLRHGRRQERQPMTLDELAEKPDITHPHRRGADDRDRPFRAGEHAQRLGHGGLGSR
jgi:hypothetical protein